MSLEDLGNIGEFVAAIAVIVTLGYLAVQIRQNTRELRLSTFHAITDRIQQQQSNLACDPELARIYRVGLADPKSLDENERIRFEAQASIQLRNWEEIFLRRRDALVDEEVWAARQVSFRRFLSQTGIRWFWKRRRDQSARSFREFLDREIEVLSANEASEDGNS